jgi:Holliday junction resolvase RusA-like endonuclease
MPTIRLTIPGKPISKKRPRFFRKGKGVGTYSDQQTEAGKTMLFISSQLKGMEPIEGAVSFKAVFYMPIPKSTSKKKKTMMMAGSIYHTKKPDCDNLEKFIWDCLNGLAWKDDAQVIRSTVFKRYDDNPRTEITIKKVEVL